MGKWAIVSALVALALIAGCNNTPDPAEASFTLTIEVSSGSDTPLAPVAWAVHSGNNPFSHRTQRPGLMGSKRSLKTETRAPRQLL
jgi:hypothetical protein